MISYQKLIAKLNENKISQYRLKKDGILGSATITKIFKDQGLSGESIDIKVVDKMCKLLKCQPGDILECVPDREGYSDTNKRKLALATKKMIRQYGSLENIKRALEEYETKSSENRLQINSLRKQIEDGEKDADYKFTVEYLELLQHLQEKNRDREHIDSRIIDLKRAISTLEEENIRQSE